jgi:hypothetical protein
MGFLPTKQVNRRALAKIAAAAATMLAIARGALAKSTTGSGTMKLVCIIRYQIDPFQREAFEKRAEHLGQIIPRNGGHLIGYFMPDEGTNDVAWGLIGFNSLAEYETYRARLRNDQDLAREDAMVNSKRVILREERNFVRIVDGTFNIPPAG